VVQPTTARPETNAATAEPLILFGDSTPFPYAGDFITLLTAVVEGCVAMLATQAGIDEAVDRLSRLEQRLGGERQQLEALVDTVAHAATTFAGTAARVGGRARAGEAAAELLQAARAVVAREQAVLEREWSDESGGVGRILDDACTLAYRALEKLLLVHVLPESRVSWELAGDESGYDALVHMSTPFGLQADFAASIPDKHYFARPLRAGELAPGTVARLPRAGEWRRAGGPRPARLDKLLISAAALEPDRIILVLRRGMVAGPGWRFVISGDDDATTAQELEDGQHPAGAVEKLRGEDRAAILRLAHLCLDATLDLPFRRQLMLDARLDAQTLRQRHEPREVCARILGALGPIVREIERRSGAPGELVLRRHIGDGRREAVFIKKADLATRIAHLPYALGKLFAPLGLQARAR
jgi:hypothetical protein